MGPVLVGVHCLSCNEFPSSTILDQTVQLLLSSTPVLHQLTMSSIHSIHGLPLLFVPTTTPNISVFNFLLSPSCICGQTVGVSSEWLLSIDLRAARYCKSTFTLDAVRCGAVPCGASKQRVRSVLDAQTQNGDEPVGEYSFLGQSCLSSADSC